MPAASLELELQWIAAGLLLKNVWLGQIAGQRIKSSLPCAFLTFETAPMMLQTAPSAAEESIESHHCVAELEGRQTNIICQHNAQGSWFAAPDNALEFGVSADGSHAWLKTAPDQLNVPAWLFGPPLILALARRGIFCLHGSAVLLQSPRGPQALVVMGQSGVGKSTMAAIAPELRLTDDISPISVNANGDLMLRPHFPQLKLARADVGIAEEIHVAGLVFLQPRAAVLQVEPIATGKDLVRRFLSHTVCARLYSSADTQAYLMFLARIVEPLIQNKQAWLAGAKSNPASPYTAQAELLAAIHDQLGAA